MVASQMTPTKKNDKVRQSLLPLPQPYTEHKNAYLATHFVFIFSQAHSCVSFLSVFTPTTLLQQHPRNAGRGGKTKGRSREDEALLCNFVNTCCSVSPVLGSALTLYQQILSLSFGLGEFLGYFIQEQENNWFLEAISLCSPRSVSGLIRYSPTR